MPKYIEENWLLERAVPHGWSTPKWVSDIVIEDAPAADVRENVRARWLPYEFGNERWHKCSACGKADEYINERGIEAIRKFCPNCGAQMDEVV